MKSVYIINTKSQSLFYGIGTYTMQVIRALNSIGLSVNVVTLFDETRSSLFIEETELARYIYIPTPEYLKKVPRAEYNLRSVDNIRYYRNVYYALFPFIRTDQELIFHFNYMHLKELAKLFKQSFDCQIVLTVHYTNWSFELSGDTNELKRIMQQPLNEKEELLKESVIYEKDFIDESVDRVIAIASHSRKMLCDIYHISPSKIVYIPNGMKDSFRKMSMEEMNEIKKKYYISPKEKILIFSGRINHVKGIDYLLEAFKLLIKVNPDVKLLIAGEGDLLYYTKKSYPCWNKIIFTGFIPKEDLFSLYSIADIGIVPSLHEEFGYVAIEMMMMGVPLIVNQSSGLSEIVEDKVNGLYVQLKKDRIPEEKGIQLLCEKMQFLLDYHKKNDLIQNARNTFLDKYSIDIFTNNMRLLYSN